MRAILLPTLLLCSVLHAQWVDISPGNATELEAVLVDDAASFMVSGGVNLRTTDGGENWTPVAGLGADGVRAFLRLDAQTILGAGAAVVRSTDNGQTWTTVTTPAPDDLHALAHQGSVVIAVGRDGGIVRSDDAGLSWSAQTSGTAERLFTVAMRSATEFIAGGRAGVLLRTVNGGTTWTALSAPVTDDWLGLHFFQGDPDTGLLCGEAGQVLRTTDGGSTWDAVVVDPLAEFTSMTSSHDSAVYIAGSVGRVRKSTDQGLTWTMEQSVLTELLTAIHANEGMVVAAGELGGVIRLGTTTGIAPGARPTATLQVWHSPTEGHARVIGGSAYPSLILLDVHGRRANVPVQRTGEDLLLDTGGLAAGTYHLVGAGRDGERAHARVLVW